MLYRTGNLSLCIVIAAGCCQAAHAAWGWVGPSTLAAVSTAIAVPATTRFHIPKVSNPHAIGAWGEGVAILCNLDGSNPHAIGACGEGVAILCNLDGRYVHRVELAVPSILVGDVVVCRHVKTEGLGDARALMLEADDLGYRPVALLNEVHPCSLNLVLGITTHIVPHRIHGDRLCCCLHGSE